MGPGTTTASNEYGRRLMPHVIDDVASKDPDREVFMSPRTSDPECMLLRIPGIFNLSIETFESDISGVRHIADLAARADHRVIVVFISSIGSVSRWDTTRGPVPEERLDDWELPRNGYSGSKIRGGRWGVAAATIRMGQIAGPKSEAGLWNRHEWLPSIIASSLYLIALPCDLGGSDAVSWVPVESAAQLVLDLERTNKKSRAMQQAPMVSPELVINWCKQWAYEEIHEH
ncbi:hypothetical protein GGR57DRAFT_501197 [Xylariaceae sp. FL1272]|nr:hypothetical protein GGR57DRAFT_501197 [Xylariaceae sp. FL1272]